MNPSLSICEGYKLNLADYTRTGLRVGIWASSGRGKSFGVGVFCEELLTAGIPVIAIDPEGELHTLREQFRILVLGGERGDLPLPPSATAVRLTLERALDEGLGLVVDLSEKPSSKAQQEAARPWLEELWVLLSERRTPAALVVEEVHIFAPQSGSATTHDIMQRFAKQGRKRGAILVAASQRTQAVSKEFMSQLNFSAIGGFETERDYEAVKFFVEGHPFDEFRALEPGRFFLSTAGAFYRWRPRRTSHGGDSPVLSAVQDTNVTVRDSALDELVEQLREAFEAEQAPVSPELSAERTRIRELEHQLSQAQKDLAEAQREAARFRAEAERLEIALKVAGTVKVLITQEVIARAESLPVPQAAVQAAVNAPTPPKIEVVQTTAQAAPVSLVKDVKLSADAILRLEEVKSMIRRARERARRRYSGAGEWANAAAKSMAAGSVVTAVDFASRYGYYGKVTINRIQAGLDALVAVGFATAKAGQYRLNEAYMRQLLTNG